MGEFDAAGETMTGAVEAGHGARGGANGACLNCGTGLIGAHCHRCGQAAHVHRTIGAIGHEIVHGVAHFEGKLWSTLPLLAWRPGELTRRYIAGERARFVSPMALFLFSIFTMFAVFSMVGIGPSPDFKADKVAAGMEEARREAQQAREVAAKARTKAKTGSAEAARLDQEIKQADLNARLLGQSANAISPGGSVKASVVTGWSRLDRGIEKAKANPSLMLYKLQANSYKFSWALIPLSLPFMWLLFCWKRRYKVYDHAVFVTYSIAFMSLLFVAVTGASAIGVSGGWVAAAVLLIPPVHLYRQLRGAYELRRWSALLRTIVLMTIIGVVLITFLLLLLGLGLVG
jgi:hypothetical protein